MTNLDSQLAAMINERLSDFVGRPMRADVLTEIRHHINYCIETAINMGIIPERPKHEFKLIYDDINHTVDIEFYLSDSEIE